MFTVKSFRFNQNMLISKIPKNVLESTRAILIWFSLTDFIRTCLDIEEAHCWVLLHENVCLHGTRFVLTSKLEKHIFRILPIIWSWFAIPTSWNFILWNILNYWSSCPEVPCKRCVLKISQIHQEILVHESLFLKYCNFIICCKCFPVSFAKLIRTHFLNVSARTFQTSLVSDDWWVFLRKNLTCKTR